MRDEKGDDVLFLLVQERTMYFSLSERKDTKRSRQAFRLSAYVVQMKTRAHIIRLPARNLSLALQMYGGTTPKETNIEP